MLKTLNPARNFSEFFWHFFYLKNFFSVYLSVIRNDPTEAIKSFKTPSEPKDKTVKDYLKYRGVTCIFYKLFHQFLELGKERA